MDLATVMSYLPRIDVLMGFVCVMAIGIVMGAVIYLPIAHKDSEIPLEKLTNDVVWKYAPDWILLLMGCLILLAVSFLLLGGMWRV